MKIKLYFATLSVIRTRDNGKPWVQCVPSGPLNSSEEAFDWANRTTKAFCKLDDSGQVVLDAANKVEYINNIVDVQVSYHDRVIETDDFEEHRPDYTVTMMVTITKRLEVTVPGSECDDDSDAEEEAIRMFHDGELDTDIECEYEYDRDYEIESVEEDD